jgi:hypothetical protein
MEITMVNAQIGVLQAPNGDKIIRVVDVQSGIIINIPLQEGAAKTIAAGLGVGIIVANGPLANGKTN